MKKTFILILFACLAGCHSHPSAVITGMEGKPLPSFDFLLMDSSTRINTKSILPGKSFVIFYFNPYCPYCRAQTSDMIAHIESLKDTRVYFLSSFPFPMVKEYYNHYELKKYPNFIVAQDEAGYFGSYYKTPGVPYIAIYNTKRQLKQVLMGNVGTNAVKDIVLQ
jgi:thiol-disulfide isomerase/thioredoxin